jgi:hypothetical protein
MVCKCHNCSPDYKFNPGECMFCHKSIPPTGGKFRSPNGARICVECMTNARKVLEEAIKQEMPLNRD